MERDEKGRFIKQPVHYVVSVPEFFLWPLELVSWTITTLVRAFLLIAVSSAMITIHGFWLT